MVDPTQFTNYQLSDLGLQEYILFCIAVAGKNAIVTARNLDNFLNTKKQMNHFDTVKSYGSIEKLSEKMQQIGFGCYNLKAKGFWWIANSGFNLRTCSASDLEKCPGIGMKTSRFFIIHTRFGVDNLACLDTHILHWMRNQGYDVPKNSPQNAKQYQKIEKLFLGLQQKSGMKLAEFDLKIWNELSGHLKTSKLS